MTQDDIKTKLTEIVRDVLDNDTIKLNSWTTAKDLADLDSLANISIMVAVEKEFKVKFNLSELNVSKNMGTIIDLIHAKIA